MLRNPVTVFVAALSLFLGSVFGFAGTASAATTRPIAKPAPAGSGSTTRPAQVQERINELKAKGATVLKVSSAPYAKVSSDTQSKSPGLTYGRTPSADKAAPSPQSYPTGCGLWVIVYRDGNLIYNSSLTSCLYTVLDIQMHSGLAWSRWWGWQELYSQTFDTDDSSYLDTWIRVDCSGTGTHDYQGVTNGFIETYGGDEYEAAAWDEIDRIECG